jgi:pimeloyl-ACP methyl ester carboxylesterase
MLSNYYIHARAEGVRGREVAIYFHKPTKLTPDSPVLLVIPGSGRNAWDYRDAWIEASEKYGALILSLHYSEQLYPNFWNYNLGGMISDVTVNQARTGFESFNIVKEPEEWIFKDFDAIFEEATRRFGVSARQYDMFGHSAGGQILQRFALFQPSNKSRRLLAANAGWYTVPRLDVPFPYGLKNSGVETEKLKSAFKSNLVVFLGELDNENETRGNVHRNADVDFQGTHRLVRGKFFYKEAKKLARQLGTDLNWTLKVVPDVGHDYRQMSKAAASILYGGEPVPAH